MTFLFVLCGCLAEKEVPEEYPSSLTEKLIQEVQKRLYNYGEDSNGPERNAYSPPAGSIHDDDRVCDFHVVEGQIIRTRDSLDAGATYIDAPVSRSRAACRKECCRLKDCELAVFKDKVGYTTTTTSIVY